VQLTSASHRPNARPLVGQLHPSGAVTIRSLFQRMIAWQPEARVDSAVSENLALVPDTGFRRLSYPSADSRFFLRAARARA
jgi:hypothetical protein